MSAVELSEGEVEQLYALLKSREDILPRELLQLLARVEKSLYGRLTVEELERLSRLFSKGV
jgi:hypothetical protein